MFSTKRHAGKKKKRHARPQKKKKGTRARAFQQYVMENAEAIPKTKLVKKNIFLPELAPDRKLVCGQGGEGPTKAKRTQAQEVKRAQERATREERT